MKKLILLCLVFTHVLDSFCQQIPNPNFSESEWVTCPFDSTQTILTPKHWFAYQTQNSKWDGPMDSTCLTFKDTLNQLFVELDQVDISKPIFIKSLMDDSTKVLLEKNQVYEANARMSFGDLTFPNFSPNCENGLCTGILVGIEIPDSTGTGTDLRINVDPATFGGDNFYTLCMATEKFDSSYLKEVIFKFSQLGMNGNDRMFAPIIFDFFYSDFPPIGKINSDTIISPLWSPNDSTYNLPIKEIAEVELGFTYSYLVMYIDSTYPSPNYPSFIDINLIDTTQQNINIFIDFETLHFQPFANIRGGLVEGNDSLRHILNLINNGGGLCFDFFAELTFDGQSNYVHNGGSINFQGKNACMQFSQGSKLVVGEDTFFEYGNNGLGMLALRTGGSIEIGKNATLFIDNILRMHEFQEENESQQIYMDLNKGSSLIFGENAKIHNDYSIDQNMKLNVLMNGGILDDSKLSPEDRTKINLIYPEPPTQIQDNVNIFPNPTTQFLNYSFILENDATVTIEMYDVTGRFIFSKKENGQKGWNEFQTDISDFPLGVYFLKVKMNDEEMVTKIVKN